MRHFWAFVPDRGDFLRLLTDNLRSSYGCDAQRSADDAGVRRTVSATPGEVISAAQLSSSDSADLIQELERTRALLDLSCELAAAGPSDEVALRLADAVRLVVDCDVVSVQLWDTAASQLVQRALGGNERELSGEPGEDLTIALESDGLLDGLLGCASADPIFLSDETAPTALGRRMRAGGIAAGVTVPLLAPDGFLGLLAFAVYDRPERLESTPDLLERLVGVASQAAVALQNGRLVDAFAQHALHDSLTGLANRLQFNEILREVVDRASASDSSVALLFIDLDGFKAINDNHGHDVGDDLLVAVGERLRGCTRGTDTVGRLGGDEFAVLIENAAGLAQVSARLQNAFCQPFAVSGRRLSVGASIGTATFPDTAGSADELLRVADAAMYEIKLTRPAAQRPERRV
jgi:diguanylate cyclase (GGDEF)-like protein